MPSVTQNNFMFYTAEEGNLNIKTFIDNETIWLTQKQIAELLMLIFQLFLSIFKIFSMKKS